MANISGRNPLSIFVLIATVLTGCFSLKARAQAYSWVKGGGSTVTYAISGDYEQVLHMCTDSNGNVYTVSNVGTVNILADTFYRALAHNSSPGLVHNLFASYNCDGTMRWAKLIEGWGNVQCGGVEYYNGSVFITGHIYSSTPHNKYIGEDTTIVTENLCGFTARFDTNGQFKWIRFIGPDINSTVTQVLATGVLAIDGQGGIHNFSRVRPGCALSPNFTTTVPGTYDLKYDFSGNLISVNQVPALDSIWMITKAVYSTQSNKWFATIQPESDYWYYVHNDWNSAVCAFRSDESLVWMDTTGINGGIVGIDYKGGKYLYVSGAGQNMDSFTLGGITVANTIGYQNSVIFKLDTNGVAHWVYNLMGDQGVNSLQSVAICSPGRIAASGLFTGLGVHGTDTIKSTTGEGQNPLFVIVDSAGNTIKLDQLHGTGFYDKGTDIASDKVGNVYLGGQVAIEISATNLAPYTTNGGNTDFFLMKYGYDCSCTSAPVASFSYTGTGIVSFTYTGTTTGMDSLLWNFGDNTTSTQNNPTHTYATNGAYTVCVTVYTSCGSDSACATVGQPNGIPYYEQENILVYPNPADDRLVIENVTDGCVLRIFNMLGQELYHCNMNGGKQVLSTKSFASGQYVMALTDSGGKTFRYVFVKE
jgi:hypothetical protein